MTAEALFLSQLTGIALGIGYLLLFLVFYLLSKDNGSSEPKK